MIGMHHLYFGLLAIFLAWFGMWRDWSVWLFVSLFVVGVWICADDIYQHWRQKRQRKQERADWERSGRELFVTRPIYHSPVHNLYVWAFGWLHSRVVRWFKK